MRPEIGETSYYLPDIIVESVLREAFDVLKRNPDIIDHVFRSMTQSKQINEKYGQKEIERIKRSIEKYDWSFVQSFNEVEGTAPCISIQLLTETEAPETRLGDYDNQARIPLCQEDLAKLIILQDFTPTGYNPLTGAISVLDSVSLAKVTVNLIFVDASGHKFEVVGGIVQIPGSQQFLIAPQSGITPDISGPCFIKSPIDFKLITIKGTTTDVNLILGVHTKEPLLTKYFYILLKYFLMVRKQVLIERGFLCSKFQGSDFTRNLKVDGDAVFSRYLTISGKVLDSFRTDEIQVFDLINVTVLVPKDVVDTEEAGFEDRNIQIGPTSQDE